MRNINDHHKSRAVKTLATRHRRLAANFPGWGIEYNSSLDKFLLDTPAGIAGHVTHVESHGMNPWTRYTILFEDGSRGVGFCLGIDFEWAEG